MIVSIHQPNFFPWLGFFDKMARCDVFILLDTAQYTKGGYQNRTQITGSQEPQWLTVPVITKGRMGQSTYDVEINNSSRWRHAHVQTLKTLYYKATYYSNLATELLSLYDNPTSKMADFNITGITWAKTKLNIDTPLVLASDLKASSSRSTLLLELVKAVGGSVYLSGPSGRNYLDEAPFQNAGIKVDYQNFKPFAYTQHSGSFIPGLSVLDYLFNVGPVPWWLPRRLYA